MRVICLDLEGVLVPEIWINVARVTGVQELNLTTRDIPDYHELMKKRLGILDRHGITLPDITAVISGIAPLEGALDFLNALRENTQVVILSDTFQEFARPIMRQLEWPTLFCNSLEVDSRGRITDYRLRQENGKQAAVRAFATMNLTVYAAGDSWNDLTMIQEAQKGAFFQPPDSIRQAHPEIPVCMGYTELQHFLLNQNTTHSLIGAISPEETMEELRRARRRNLRPRH